MFELPRDSELRRRRTSLSISVFLHGTLLFWLLRPPVAIFVSPSGIRQGEHGTSLAPIYLSQRGLRDAEDEPRTPGKKTNIAEHSSTQLRSPRPDDRVPSEHKVLQAKNEQEALASARSEPQQAESAGAPLGSLSEGALTGQEVRPALPIFGPQPMVAPSELPQGVAGDVVAEITIDEQGNVTRVALVNSIGYGIDEKILMILPTWHFKPATRDGVAIASQQDVYFHFANNISR